MKLVVDLPVKACRECRFSRGGQLFAAASGPNIHLYNGNTFEALGIFKGHSGAVRSLFWLPEDAGLVSGGLDGAVYEWRLDGRARVDESTHVLKTCQYEAVVCGARDRVLDTGCLVVGSTRLTHPLPSLQARASSPSRRSSPPAATARSAS